MLEYLVSDCQWTREQKGNDIIVHIHSSGQQVAMMQVNMGRVQGHLTNDWCRRQHHPPTHSTNANQTQWHTTAAVVGGGQQTCWSSITQVWLHRWWMICYGADLQCG